MELKEKIEKYNKRYNTFGVKIMLCEENGKCIAHHARGENLSMLDFVDEVVCEEDWELFKIIRKLTKEELEKCCFDTSKSAPILFHGTSTFYIENIRKNGFKKRNIVEELNLEEMLIELEEACIEKNILYKSYWKSNDLECVFETNKEHIIKDAGAEKKEAEEINVALYTHVRHIKKNVEDFHYGSLFFTTSIRRAINYAISNQTREKEGVIRGTLGEYFDIIILVYRLYKVIIGESYSFKNEKYNELMQEIYDNNNNCISEWIQPVLIAVRDIPWGKLTNEMGDGEFLGNNRFLRNNRNKWMLKKRYVEIQDSARYIGENISSEKLEIVELKDIISDGKIDENLFQKLYDRFEISD